MIINYVKTIKVIEKGKWCNLCNKGRNIKINIRASKESKELIELKGCI